MGSVAISCKEAVYAEAQIWLFQNGVSAATVLHRIQHEIRLKRKDRIGYRFHPVSPKDLVARLGLSRATISRAVQVLVDKDMLRANPSPQGRRKEYEVVDRPPAPAESAAAGSQNRT